MRVKVLMLLFVAILSGDCFSHGLDTTSASSGANGRYIGYRKSPPSAGQVNPLDAPMGRISPQSLTVGRALKDLLAGTSYILAQGFSADPEVSVLLDARLPQQQRHLRNLSIHEALTIIAGDPWLLVIDPVNRMISFELPYPYQDDPVITKARPNNGMQLLGFDDVESVNEQVRPVALSDQCKNITRDMTVEWSKRAYWCYPLAHAKKDLCHD